MLTPIILVLGLMAATAVIAYWSDNLGKKLGKKRVSLFGLRPKQTATLITITSSMPIMLFTLGALLAVHKPLRVALMSYDSQRHLFDVAREESQRARADEKIARVQEQKARDNENIQSLKAAAEALRAQRASRSAVEAEKRKREAEKREHEATGRAEAAREGERKAREGERSARAGEEGARLAEIKAQGRLASAQTRLQTARTKLAGANVRLASASSRLAGAESRLVSTQARLASTQADLGSAQAGLTRARGQLDRETKTQAKKILAQTAQILAKEEQATALTAQIESLKAEVEQSKVAVEVASQELRQVRMVLSDVQNTPTLVPAGETLAERVIAPRQSPSEFNAQLDSLLDEARTQARRLGEGAGKLNMSIAFPAQTATLPDGSSFKIDEAAQKSILARQLASADAPSSVRVITARAHTKSESKIEVRLRAIEVRTAFGRGDVLASANISGRDGDARIFKQLLDLANVGQSAAEKKGVVPPLARDVPFYAPGTNERIFEALRSIQALKGLAQVRIVAADDLSTASPLRVRFDVAPASSARQSA